MALKTKTINIQLPEFFTDGIGIEVGENQFYIKITHVISTAKTTRISVVTSIYLGMDEDIDGSPKPILKEMFFPVRDFSFEHDIDGDNFIKQGYEYLKSLPEFFGCIDF